MKTHPAHFCLVIIGLLPQLSLAETEATWRSGAPLPEDMAPTAIREMAADWELQHAQGGLADRHALVQFSQPPSAQTRNALADAGVLLLTPLGGNAFFASIDAGKIDPSVLEQTPQLSGLHDIRTFPVAYRS